MHARSILLGFLLCCGAASLQAGELINDTKESIAIQQGVRDGKTGEFTWSATVVLKPGEAAKIPEKHFYRHDTHVGDGKVTWSLPASMAPSDPRDYFFLFGKEVRVDVVRK